MTAPAAVIATWNERDESLVSWSSEWFSDMLGQGSNSSAADIGTLELSSEITSIPAKGGGAPVLLQLLFRLLNSRTFQRVQV